MPAVPMQSPQPQFPMALGQNGMVDCRLFYFTLGVIVAGGFLMYCNRKN